MGVSVQTRTNWQPVFGHIRGNLKMPASDIVSVLSQVNYRHPELTKRQVQTLLHHYKGLSPKKDKFTFNDGQEKDLINIQVKGTLTEKTKNLDDTRVRSRCHIGVRTTTSQSHCTCSTPTPTMRPFAMSSQPLICRSK